jgi:hypothetical protein
MKPVKARLPLQETLEFKRLKSAFLREHWFMSSCRGEAAALYLEFDDGRWVELQPDPVDACWVLGESDIDTARETYGDGESHYPVRDAGAAYGLAGARINRVTERRLGDRIEVCIEFVNATDLTLHYNLITYESSLYFTRD